MKISVIEPAILLNAFAMTLTTPLTAQYVYRRMWKDMGNYTFASDDNVSKCEVNKSDPVFAFQEEVQKKVSLFSLQMDISGLIPGLVSTFMLLSSSDSRGRKLPMILSSIGALGTSIWLCLLSYFTLPLQLLIASTFIAALFGNFTTFWGACFAYIVDQCKEDKQKTIRIAVVDFMLGIVTGLTGLSSGYFIKELGFVWSFFIIATVLTVNLIYILFFLNDPIKESSSQIAAMSCCESLRDLFYRSCMLFKNGSAKRRASLYLLIFTVAVYFFVIIGISPIFTLYELGSPLCWNEVFIGYGSALGNISFLSSFLGIWLFSYCLEDIYITLIGIITTAVGMILAAFAKTTLMMFLGALFACIAVFETLGGATAVSAYNGIYSATVAWYPGFVFLLSAGLLVIPVMSLCVVKFIGWGTGSYVLLIQEEPGDHTSDR